MTVNLKNHYFVLRHGESWANQRRIILSNLTEGSGPADGLTVRGEKSVRTSVAKARKAGWLDSSTIIYSSPFSRCRQTAEIAKQELEAKTEIVYDERLRERWFGDWENTSNKNYLKVWLQDLKNQDQSDKNVESVSAVKERMLSLLNEVEQKFSGRTFLLVSHGDPLQILESSLRQEDYVFFRALKHLEKAELRKVERA